MDSILFIAAEIEFFDHLNEIIVSGEYITTVEVETLYKIMMHNHTINKPITRRSFISNISQNMPYIVILCNIHGFGESSVSVELMMTMSRWILQGSHIATTRFRNLDLHKSCAIISQIKVQELKT